MKGLRVTMHSIMFFLICQDFSKLEVPTLIPGSSHDLLTLTFILCWKRGSPAAMDVTVISPLQQSTINEAAANKSHALQVAEARRNAFHQATL